MVVGVRMQQAEEEKEEGAEDGEVEATGCPLPGVARYVLEDLMTVTFWISSPSYEVLIESSPANLLPRLHRFGHEGNGTDALHVASVLGAFDGCTSHLTREGHQERSPTVRAWYSVVIKP